MQLITRARFELARRPWIYWTLVAALAVAVVALVRAELATIDARRDAWGTRRVVLVVDGDHAPGDEPRVRRVTLPAPAVPQSALSTVTGGARLRQHVADGEVLVDVDILAGDGPAARAPSGTVVVAIVDPLMRAVRPGARVEVAAEGTVIAAPASIADVVDEVAFVAVDPTDAAAVAAAARLGTASLLYVP
jgi:hypothetical protein